MDKKIIAVVNPAAAGGKAVKIWPKKNEYFKQEFSNFEEIYTREPGEAVKFAQKAVEENYDYIMSVGGDGTVNEIINGILSAEKKELRTKLIIYPLGTGSDLSRTLNLPTNIEDFIDLVKQEKSRSVRVVEADFFNYQQQKTKRYFLNIADCGMGAEVAKKLNESKKTIDGSLSYLIKIFQTLFNYQNKEVKVEADNKLLYQGKIRSVIIAQGNYFGGGIKIAPEAGLFSDKLNLVLLKDFSKLGIILNLIKAYKGKHLSHSLVESHQVEKIKISSQERVELELDGESVGICDSSFKISEKEIEILI
ncbi:YegS/Rv2252/BmrU family lipid kinase [Halanaerobium saccharolyticum]|uniref:YegS/Rv2252/BmrU family lipid kinase n=1 Tax=Halanaerobium saccharolyticum TaxID=43595 RepID=A0A4R6LFU1_9FIRM|nr:diacylglycerol kinase family protein [Halanaerobium saccharolyticum]TDO78284.1 YegS/Rv2252/BmrU family lipid kinase [Halanaerobium saccharolyticum]